MLTARERELAEAMAEHPHGAFLWLMMGPRLIAAFQALTIESPVSVMTCPCGVRPCECA